MTNEESMKNIETLKKLVYLYRDDYIYFEFTNATDFNIVCYSDFDIAAHGAYIDKQRKNNLPISFLWPPPGQTGHLKYKDNNLSYVLNLTTGEYTSEDANAPLDMDEVRRQYQALTGQFK